MPLYVYEVVLPDGSGGEQFEVLQKMSDAALTKHPETGEPVRRVFGEPNAPRTWTDRQGKAKTQRQEPRGEGLHEVRQDRRRHLREDHRHRAEKDQAEVIFSCGAGIPACLIRPLEAGKNACPTKTLPHLPRLPFSSRLYLRRLAQESPHSISEHPEAAGRDEPFELVVHLLLRLLPRGDRRRIFLDFTTASPSRGLRGRRRPEQGCDGENSNSQNCFHGATQSSRVWV